MTDIQDAAVQIAADAIRGEHDYLSRLLATDVVAALAREYEFCPPGTTTEIERLWTAIERVRRLCRDAIANAEEVGQGHAVVVHPANVLTALDVLDDIPPTDGHDPAAAQGEEWCNCQVVHGDGGPWHPLGDTTCCFSVPQPAGDDSARDQLARDIIRGGGQP